MIAMTTAKKNAKNTILNWCSPITNAQSPARRESAAICRHRTLYPSKKVKDVPSKYDGIFLFIFLLFKTVICII